MRKCGIHYTKRKMESWALTEAVWFQSTVSPVPPDKEHSKYKVNNICLGLYGSHMWWLAIHDKSSPQLFYCILGPSFPSTIPQPSIPNSHSLNSVIKSQFLTSDFPVKSNSLSRSLLLATHLQQFLYTIKNYFPLIIVVFCCHSFL